MLFLVSCSTESTFVENYCSRAAQCVEVSSETGLPIDGVGRSLDSIDVCAVEQHGYIDSLYAMDLKSCHIVASAYEAYLQCVANSLTDIDPCAPWKAENDHPCVTAFETYRHLAGGDTDTTYAQYCPRLGKDTLSEPTPGSGFSDFIPQQGDGDA